MPETPPAPITVGELSASFHQIETPYGLVVDALNVKGGRCVVTPEPFSLTLDRPGDWEAFIEEDALQAFVESKVPAQLRNVRVKLVPGEIRVTASVQIIVDLNVEAICTLAIRDRKSIWVELQSVSVGGGAAKNLVQQQLDKVNPVLDAKDLPLNLMFDAVQILQGELVVTGKAEP